MVFIGRFVEKYPFTGIPKFFLFHVTLMQDQYSLNLKYFANEPGLGAESERWISVGGDSHFLSEF